MSYQNITAGKTHLETYRGYLTHPVARICIEKNQNHPHSQSHNSVKLELTDVTQLVSLDSL